jgi:hypothetical protein
MMHDATAKQAEALPLSALALSLMFLASVIAHGVRRMA